MKFLNKLKEVVIPIIPIVMICLLVHFFINPFSSSVLISFFIGLAFLIVGETLFLMGADKSIIEMGEIVGNSSNKSSKFFLLLIFAFIFGVFATVAEPDASVLGGQVQAMGANIKTTVFVFVMGFGVGLMIGLALFRIATGFSLKFIMAILIGVTFVMCLLSSPINISIAFDAGGASTGVITSPFLIAIATGVAINTSRKNSDDTFGAVGIASFGPILALLIYFLISRTQLTATDTQTVEALSLPMVAIEQLKVALISVAPLVIFFFIYELIFVKLPKEKVVSLLISSCVTYVGLFLFLTGIEFGVNPMGQALGVAFENSNHIISIIICAALGFIIAFAEPAVRILGEQVEDVTSGFIKSKVVVLTIGIAMAVAVSLSVIRIVYNIDFVVILGVCYALVLLLTLISDSVFIGIGFDSGGVASGPMSVAFMLPIMIGLAGGAGGFGLIAIIAVMPIIALETLGLVYKIKLFFITVSKERRVLRVAYDMDKFGNMDKLKRQAMEAGRK